MVDQVCPIWNRPAKVNLKHGTHDVYEVRSPRAGGLYEITSSAKAMVQGKDRDFLVKSAEYICQSNAFGSPPRIDSNAVKKIADVKLPWVGERAERLLCDLERRSVVVGTSIGFDSHESDRAQALTASIGDTEVSYLLEMLRDDGFISFDGYANGLPIVRITPLGYRHLHQLRAQSVDVSQAFVAMWFSDTMKEAYDLGIEPGVRAAGYKPLRIDRKEHNNKIDDEIVAEIRRSKFVVADFTSEPEKARGGVYFEAGFAMGLGKPVIWTCREDCLAHVHFDTRQYAHIAWKTPEDLKSALAKRISAVLGDGPEKQST